MPMNHLIRRTNVRRTTPILAGTLLLAGCAVMEIDVDVYKGPLSNEQDVKLEQYAAMAIGAKPILIQLRDGLEWPTEQRRSEARVKDKCYNAGVMPALDNRHIKLGSEVLPADYAASLDRYKPEAISEAWKNCGSKEKAFQEKTEEAYFGISQEGAMRVNNIIALYDDEKRPQDRQKVKAASAQEKPAENKNVSNLQTIRDDYAEGTPPKLTAALDTVIEVGKKDKHFQAISALKRWQFELLLRDRLELVRGDIVLNGRPISRRELQNSLRRASPNLLLAKAYRYLMGVKSEATPDPIPLELLIVWLSQNKPELRDIPAWARAGIRTPRTATHVDMSWNSAFDRLRDTERTESHASIIFGDKEVPDGFVDRIRTIGQQFLSSRVALRDLWSASLSKLGQAVSDDPKSAKSEAAISLARSAAAATQPLYVAAAYCELYFGGLSARTSELHRRLSSLFGSSIVVRFNRLNGSRRDLPPAWVEADFFDVEKLIRQKLLTETTTTVAVLREIDEMFKSREQLSQNCGIHYDGFDTIGTKDARQFGMVRAALTVGIVARDSKFTARPSSVDKSDSDKKDDTTKNQETSAEFASFREDSVQDFGAVISRPSQPLGGLGRGRLPWGLETLIENFVGARSCVNVEVGSGSFCNDIATRIPGASPKDRASISRERLHGALLRFSEKLLFVANHDVLLRENGNGKSGNGSASSDDDEEFGKDEQEQFALVLQAIGNAIQTLGNEHAARQGYDRASLQAFSSEMKALNAAWAGSGIDMSPCITSVKTSAIQSQALAPTGSPPKSPPPPPGGPGGTLQRDALDCVIAFLRHRLLKETYDKGAKTKQHVEDALKLAYEQRANMAYIRPAAFYLRSSYAATGLQKGNSVLWRNRLTEHGIANLPLIGGHFANDDTARARANVISEIDKQFWQTINNVKVKGAGATNYAIAKDDIGNWYVKGFSADTTSITRSAFSLATAQLGVGASPSELANINKDGTPADDGGAKKKGDSLIASKISKDRTADQENAKASAVDLAASLQSGGGISQRIQGEWAKHPTVQGVYQESAVQTSMNLALDDARKGVLAEIGKTGNIKAIQDRYVAHLVRLGELASAFERHMTDREFSKVLDAGIAEQEAAAKKDRETAKNTTGQPKTDAEGRAKKAEAEAARLSALKKKLPEAQKAAIALVHSKVWAEINDRSSIRLKTVGTYFNTLKVLSQTVAN